MGRKRTAEELNKTADNNGFVAGAYEDEDQIEHTRDDYTKRYIQNQDESLDLWRIFMSNRGVSAAECLYTGCPVLTNVIVKEFARWYCTSRSGRIDKRPNLTSVKNTLKKFFSGFIRVTGTTLSDEFRNDIYIWVRNTLPKQGFTTIKKRDKFLFDVDDLVNVVVCAWTKDDSVFIHECMRVQMTFLILIYCFSGARIGAFLHNGKTEVEKGEGSTERVVFEGLVWKDVLVYLLPLPDGTTEVVLKIVQRWVKNNKDPENSISEVSTYQHQKLRFDVAAFLLALAFRDDVFDGISSPAQLWDQRVPEDDALLQLRMKSSKLNLPVLRTVTRHEGLSDRMLDDSTFRYYFQRIVVNAGYYGNLTIHALRRALANAVDKRATPGERNQLLGHSASDVYSRAYISSISSVDGQAAFLREEGRVDHIAKLRSVSTQRAQGLPQKLPVEKTAELLQDPKACELHRRLRDLRENDATSQAVEDAKREFKTYRYWLNKRALEQWKEDWLETRYQQVIKTGGKASYDKSTLINRVQALFRIMPERARLVNMINSNEPCTRDQKLLAVQDLLSLCIRDFEVMYRPGEEPINGKCPVENASSLRHHLGDVHGLSRGDWKIFGGSTATDKSESSSERAAPSGAEIVNRKKSSRSRKIKPIGITFIDCSPSIKFESCDQLIENHQPTDVSRSKKRKMGPKYERNIVTIDAVEIDAESPSSMYMDICTKELDAHVPLSHKCYSKLSQNSQALIPSGDESRTRRSLIPLAVSSHDQKVVEKEINFTVMRSVDNITDILNIPLDPDLFSDSPNPAVYKESSQDIMTPQDNHAEGYRLARSDPFLGHISDLSSSNIGINEQHDGITGYSTENSSPIAQKQNWKDSKEITILQEELDDCYVCEKPRDHDTAEEPWFIAQFAHDNIGPAVQSELRQKKSGCTESKCPICGSHVPSQRRRRNKPMSFRQQMAFCKNHKTMNAKTEWAERNYPRIAWRRLNIRMEKHTSSLRDILKGESPSFYCSLLKSAVDRREKHKYRCIKSATAGYYGPRGQQIMAEHIILKLGSELRQKAVADRFLSTIGVADFVTVVLVPELAVMLIKEDMKTCDEMARKILHDSARLGEILNDDC